VEEDGWHTYGAWRAWLDANGFGAQKIMPTTTAPDQGMTFGTRSPEDSPVTDKVWAYSGMF
jgi:hypothetical protein